MQRAKRDQLHLRTIILCLEHQRIRRYPDMFTLCIPHQRGGKGHTVGDGHKLDRIIQIQQFACGSKSHHSGCGIAHFYRQHQTRACQHTCIIHQNHGRLVVAWRDGNLHIAHHTADHHAVAPLLNQNSDIILARHGRSVPNQISRNRIYRDGIGSVWH